MKEYRLSPNGNLYTYDEYMKKITDLNMHDDDIGLINTIWESYPVIPVKTKKQLERLRYIYKKPEKELNYETFMKKHNDLLIWGSIGLISDI